MWLFFFLCGITVNKIPSCGLVVISNRMVCDVFYFKAAVFGEKNYLQILCNVVVYCLTHLTALPLLSNCQNLYMRMFSFFKEVF